MKPPVKLNTHTLVRVERLFKWADREKAKTLLLDFSGIDPLETERLRFAALRVSDGNLAKLTEAIEMGKQDFRDLLVVARFASHPEQHQRWWPEDKVSVNTPSPDNIY